MTNSTSVKMVPTGTSEVGEVEDNRKTTESVGGAHFHGAIKKKICFCLWVGKLWHEIQHGDWLGKAERESKRIYEGVHTKQ